MLDSYRLKQWIDVSVVRAHISTLGICLSFNNWWRVPRDAFRYGGLAYGLAHSVALVLVALPVALLQLAVGQLSQQDAVGIWRAVPFFKGVGYLRLLITSLGSIYTSLYLALSAMNFFYTLSNPYPSWECTELIIPEALYETSVFNSSLICYNETFLSPVAEQPENYVAIALIICALWIVFPFMLYSPIKFMKRIFYVLVPVIIVLAIVILSSVGNWKDLSLLQKSNYWPIFLNPDIWYAAFIQALWSAQIAGGYLISSGDNVYSNTNVQWSTLILIGLNVVTNWMSLVFWFAIGGSGEKDMSAVAVLFQIYNMASEKQLNKTWPLLVFALLFFSGIITMLTLLMPLYDRFRRIGGTRWRLWAAGSSLVGGGAALAVLAGKLPLLHALEDIATPLLISIATILEISAFIFIYGWKILLEDVEFLTGHGMSKVWVIGWCIAPGVIAPFSAWWVVTIIQDTEWSEAPWQTIALITAAGVALIIFVSIATITIARQVQYDFIGKLKSSFEPSRHWGPRDPITHYYWLARRDEVDRRNVPRTRYHRRHLGQLAGRASFVTAAPEHEATHNLALGDIKRRTNSDDWVYTVQRNRNIEIIYGDHIIHAKRRRSKSLDWEVAVGKKTKNLLSVMNSSSKTDMKTYFLQSVNEKNSGSRNKPKS